MAWSPKKRVVVCCSVGWILATIGAIMIPVVAIILKKVIQNTVIIKEGGEVYEYWQDPPVPIYMQIYMFNLTNPDEFLAGAKPSLDQFGPYTYSERRIKFNITWNNNGTVTYRQQRLFHFLPDMSTGSESDMFLTPNPVVWALFNGIRFEDPVVKQLLASITGLLGSSIMMTRTVREIVWGYDDPILKIAKQIDPDWFYTDFIGYFMNKNNTDDGVYTVVTGEKDIDNLGVIQYYNGSKYLDFWTTEWANMINGSDGTLGPPYLDRDRALYTFASDVCRSVSGSFSHNVETPQGIKLWRFEASMLYLANASVNPDNLGFCTPQTHCLGAGLYNATVCQGVDFFNLPAIISLPHFLFADPKYQDAVEGLRPDPEQHQVQIDLEPYTGLVLQAYKRLQVNIFVEPIPDIEATQKLTGVFLPVFWINESAAIDDKNADKLKNMLFIPILAIEIVEYVIIGIGGMIVILTAVYLVKVKYSIHIDIHRGRKVVNCDENCDTRPIMQGSGDAQPIIRENGETRPIIEEETEDKRAYDQPVDPTT